MLSVNTPLAPTVFPVTTTFALAASLIVMTVPAASGAPVAAVPDTLAVAVAGGTTAPPPAAASPPAPPPPQPASKLLRPIRPAKIKPLNVLMLLITVFPISIALAARLVIYCV